MLDDGFFLRIEMGLLRAQVASLLVNFTPEAAMEACKVEIAWKAGADAEATWERLWR